MRGKKIQKNRLHIMQKNTNVVLDVEMFHEKIIRELAICTPFYIVSFVFRPPHPFDKCTDQEKDKTFG